MSRAKLAKGPVSGASTPILTGPGACASAASGAASSARVDSATIAITWAMAFLSGFLQRGQDVLGEQADVLLRQIVGQAAELEEPHEDAGAELPHLRLDL